MLRGVPEVHDTVCQHTVNNNNDNNNDKTIQPDWLKTTLTEVADVAKYI